jgi:hypothetical protein
VSRHEPFSVPATATSRSRYRQQALRGAEPKRVPRVSRHESFLGTGKKRSSTGNDPYRVTLSSRAHVRRVTTTAGTAGTAGTNLALAAPPELVIAAKFEGAT